MLKRIKIKNFLSFDELNIDLRRLNVLIGPNMSGKSNFIECLRFVEFALNPAFALMPMGISQDSTPLQPTPPVGRPSALRGAFNYLGGFSDVLWKGTAQEQPIEIHLEVQLQQASPKSFEYDFVIEGSRQFENVEVLEEKLTQHYQGKSLVMLHRKQDVVCYRTAQTSPEQNLKMPQKDRLALETIIIPGSELDLFRNFVTSWRFYRLNPLLIKINSRNFSLPQPFLVEDGRNLSSWLFTIQGEFPSEFERIIETARDIFPAINKLIIRPMQSSMVSLSSLEKDLALPVPLWRMSDGELVFLAYLSLLFSPPQLGSPLYCIEEPEAYLHPYLLEVLVEMVKQRQQELEKEAAQLIVTTHSPLLVDQLDIEDLIVVQKEKGATRFKHPASNEHLRELVASKELGLGDIWYSGALEKDEATEGEETSSGA
ncbi:AAA family ATPase [Methylacidiphilum caldifontis]|uniref:ATPase AAA-type core domain-containing protein n=1 Tax=Methylacidiphilum caldifontis TaxID=2795386 RepID=A0A4Y8PC40_9BACT|nr:AAA family ATPase [Methylacidiphilum caldifontis]TFE68770.1 hypothetical protein A7Q10_07775 [Methylacidiphilum caldifontis]